MILNFKKNKNVIPLISDSRLNLFVAEQYRQIRTNILFASVDKEIKSIMITSSDPNEGKTTTAANLAIVLAQQQKKVLIVDTDLRKPSLHHAFNVGDQKGLTDVLTKQISLDEAIIKSSIPNMDILTSGVLPSNPSELLGSISMDSVIKELKKRFEYIIFDTPPVLAFTDAQVLANKCDGLVMVIARGKTNKERAIKAKELLKIAKSQLLGVVVNEMKNKQFEF